MVQKQITPEGCEFCDTEQATAVVITKECFEEAELTTENVHWVCSDHYHRIIEETDYYVREVPPGDVDGLTTPDGRYIREGKSTQFVVLQNPGETGAWMWFNAGLERDLKRQR